MKFRSLSGSAHSADVTSSAAAPSLIPDELPAVTVPPARNAGRRPARPSSVVSGLGCSSASTTTGAPRGRGTVTGTISSANRPSRCAAAARCWLSQANTSWSSREMP